MKKILVYSLLIFIFTLGCQDSGVKPIPPQPDVNNVGILLSIPQSSTSAVADFPVSGSVLASDSAHIPPAVVWNTPGRSSGSFPVDPATGKWNGTITLVPGDNTIVFSIPDTEATSTIYVVYNEGYSFSGKLVLLPDIVYLNEARDIIANIALHDPKTNPDVVKMIRLDDGTELATLTDDGNLDNGDEIEADGIYSCKFSITASALTVIPLRVVVGLLNVQQTALSEVFDLRVSNHLTPEEAATILAKQDQYQQMIEGTAPEDLPAVLDQIVAELKADPTIADVAKNESGQGVWMVYNSGIAGVVYNPAAGNKGGPRGVSRIANMPAQRGSQPGRKIALPHYDAYYTPRQTGTLEDNHPIQSKKVRAIAAQYFDWGEDDDVPLIVEMFKQEHCFDVEYTQYSAKGVGSVEDFKNLGHYGVLLISSHGDSFYKGLLSLWKETFQWNGPFGEVVLHSNAAITSENQVTYEDDLKAGRLVLWGSNYGIMPNFIRQYSGKMNNTLVYMSICRGTWNDTMANAFLSNGAGAYLGYSDYVAVSFCVNQGPAVFTKLLETTKPPLKEAFVPGNKETDEDPAEFILYGDNLLTLGAEGLLDASFESGVIAQAWKVEGDARIIMKLGASSPTEGTQMAIISTGLGFTESSGSLSQEFCLSSTAKNFSVNWNFFSEEWMEWVGSQYQDEFTITLSDAENPDNSVVILHETIDSLQGSVSKVENSFDQGDVYATGWQTKTFAIPENLKGKRVEIKFFATDVGDSIFDSAILIDNIQITE